MPVWSSPFPCRVPDGWEPPVPFPGPAGSLLVFDTPDRVLQSWGRDDQCDGAELERFEQGCQELLKLREQDSHVVQPCWADGPAPSADGITACLLMLVLQSNPEALISYQQLDPDYLHRLLRAQSHPRQLLNRWLQPRTTIARTDQPLERQLQAALTELDQRVKNQRHIETLLAQHQAQQRRTRRLLVRWIRPQDA